MRRICGWYLSRVDWKDRHDRMSTELANERRTRKVLDAVGNEFVQRNTEPYLEAASLRNDVRELTKQLEEALAQKDVATSELKHEKRVSSGLRGQITKLKG